MSLLRPFIAFLLAFSVIFGAGLATAQAPALPPATGATGVLSIQNDPNYKLGAGDKLRITTYGEPTLTGDFFVNAGGSVSFPLIGDVRATGLTMQTFKSKIEAGLKEGYLNDPRVSVEVLTYRPYYVLGEVGRPGEYPYTSDLTVMNAVATASGFSYRANKKKVFIRHAGEASEREYPLTSTTMVQPGDTLRIAERYF